MKHQIRTIGPTKILIIQAIAIAMSFLCAVDCNAQKKSWGVQMAESIMNTYPDSIVVKATGETAASKPKRPAQWNYEYGVLLKSFDQLKNHTGDQRYFDYSKKIIDHFIREDGSIRTYELVEYNIDHITPGRIVLLLYSATKQEKYRKAAALLHDQLVWQPRTKEGGYWHKLRYPYQMWLDGLYMGETFSAEYSMMFNDQAKFDDIANQFVWMEKHVRDPKTGLMYHAWDESKMQRWANPVTGQAPGFWGRGMGWYGMALVDVLDYFPKNHPRRKELIDILQRYATAVKHYQEATSGLWYQVLDQGNRTGNYFEASASCMFTYALAKGVRMGYIDKGYAATARKAFAGITTNFIETDEQGFIHLTKVVSVGGLGGTPYRDGSFEYYISEPLRTDDLKGVGPFIQASIEVELLK
ncbi:glycoside hydrolase family 88 protein [Chryseolinea sp. T2]|uniref:glycoside hydrolase family 88/105 protein n=1 Tax=Chryseolinea sp. T2 TaxID=3129255 RepID=UPI003077435E